MYKIIEWFQLNFPHLRDELKDSMHNFDDKDLNPYHLESDCWSHTMMVCKIAELEGYDKVVQISALLHDIGKPSVRKVNPRNNHVQYFDHEIMSAYLSIEVLEKMRKEGLINKDEAVEIVLLVALHSTLYKVPDSKKLFGVFEHHKTLFIHLLELTKCDHLGRFCEDSSYDDNKERTLRSLAIKMKDKPFATDMYALFETPLSLDKVESVITKNIVI